MHEELVKRLRETTFNHEEKCDSCPYEDDYPCCVDCLDEMHIEAADAIEELSAIVMHNKEFLEQYGGETGIKDLNEFAGKYWDALAKIPRWIPVTERLPDNIDEEVLVCNEGYGKDGTGFATVAVYNGNGWLECWERKQYLSCITHWMPLPEPPKEET